MVWNVHAFTIIILLLIGISSGVLWAFISSKKRNIQDLCIEAKEKIISQSTALVTKGADEILSGICEHCLVLHEKIIDNLYMGLNLCEEFIEARGGIYTQKTESVTWNAIDQETTEFHEIVLPKMFLENSWLGKLTTFEEEARIVDTLRLTTGYHFTIFQRMNELGDMLRVSTSIEDQNGKRAIETFISQKYKNETINPIISTVLKGDSYQGIAMVLKEPYISVYKPLKDISGKIIGMLFCGKPLKSAIASFKNKLMKTQIHKSGYISVLSAMDEIKGSYIISKNGTLDGVNIWNEIDVEGRYIIQDIINYAISLKPDLEGNMPIFKKNYLWADIKTSQQRKVISSISYFEKWKWVIMATVYKDDFDESTKYVNQAFEPIYKDFNSFKKFIIISSSIITTVALISIFLV